MVRVHPRLPLSPVHELRSDVHTLPWSDGVDVPTLAAGGSRSRCSSRRGDLAAPGQGGAGGGRRRRAGRSVVSADPRRVGAHRHRRQSGGAADSTGTAPRTCWRPRSRISFPACSAASVRPPTKASSTTSSCRARSCPRISRPSRRRCASWRSRISSTSVRCGRATRRGSSSATRGEPLKVQLIDEKTEGQADGLLLHHQGPGHLRRLLRRPARALDRPAEGLQAARRTSNAYWKGDARNQPMQRVYGTAFLIGEGAAGAPDAARGGQEARPPQDRHAIRSCSCSTRGRRARPSGSPRARRSTTRWPTTCAACSFPAGYVEVKAPHRLQQGAVGDVRPLAALPRRTCSWSRPRRRADGPQGHELPRPHADLRERDAQLPRPAPSASTSRRRCTATRRRACSRA